MERLYESDGYHPAQSNVRRMLGYFSLLGLLRVHAVLGDYTAAMQVCGGCSLGVGTMWGLGGIFTEARSLEEVTCLCIGLDACKRACHCQLIHQLSPNQIAILSSWLPATQPFPLTFTMLSTSCS